MTPIFKNKKVILPVIHVENSEQGLRNAVLAHRSGADGVFIISHGVIDAAGLFDLAKLIKHEIQGFWVGVNCLGLSALEAAQIVPMEVNGLWTDNAHIDERILFEQEYARKVKDTLQERGWYGRYFGGVAFKYQREVVNLELAVEKSKPYMDVICTSGVGTGHAADLSKMQRMKAAAGDFPIAIASGITPENVIEYLPYIDYFLVATGISKSFTELDEGKTKQLIKNIRDGEQNIKPLQTSAISNESR